MRRITFGRGQTMKTLLIQPPALIFKDEAKSCHPPLGLAYLAAMLRDLHEVHLLDCVAEGFDNEEKVGEYVRYGLSLDEIKKRISEIRPEVVGVSCLFSSAINEAMNICKIAKGIDPKIITILGGAHPSAMPEETLKEKEVDYVIVGEGEYALRNLLNAVENRKSISSLKGVAFRDKAGISFEAGDKIEDLDQLPFPAWDMLPMEKYFAIKRPHGGTARKTPFFPMITSRGCPNACTFCSIHTVWGRKYRSRSAANVLSEIRYLRDKFNCKEIFFEDDNLTLDKNRAMLIFKGIIEKFRKITWSSPNGVAVNTIDDELLNVIKKSGCRALSFGIESGDAHVLNNIIKKSVNIPHAEKIIKDAGRMGIETSVFFVIGFPDETRAQLENTLKLSEEIKADNINFFFATPLPGTELFQRCKELGLLKDGPDLRFLRSGKPHFDMADLSKNRLESLIADEKLRIHKRLLIRKPQLFIKKLLNKFINDPMYFSRLGNKI